MISVYSKWTEKEQDAFYRQEWGVGDWDWWSDFVCSEFKEEWTFDDLSKALKEDIDSNVTLDEIKVKYLK